MTDESDAAFFTGRTVYLTSVIVAWAGSVVAIAGALYLLVKLLTSSGNYPTAVYLFGIGIVVFFWLLLLAVAMIGMGVGRHVQAQATSQ